MQHRDRPEPGLGRLDGIDIDADGDRRRPAAARSVQRARATRGQGARSGAWLLLALLAVAAVAVYVMRDELRLHFPGSETRELLNAAARAEADGRWRTDDTGDDSGQGRDALSLYRRVLVGDPDNDVARLGLSRVGTQLAADAQAAIDAGDVATAADLIDELERIGEAGADVAALRQRLSVQQASGSELSTLLADAQAALARRRIRGDNGALVAFKRMLAVDPANAVAQRGIDDALAILVEEAGKEIAAGRIDSARAMADVVAAEHAQHAALPALLRTIADAQTAAQARTAEVEAAEANARIQAERTAAAEQARSERETLETLARGDEALRSGDIEAAVDAYRRVLARSPGHAEAGDGLDIAGRAALEQAGSALASSDPTRAASALALARRAQADPDALARLDGQLADLNERLTAVLAQPDLDADQLARLDELMARARAAEERGDLVEPVGASAYDLYRQALTIDPMHDDARRAAAALPRRAQTLVVHHAELGQLDQAASAIDALQAMAPLDPSLPELRRQIASAWLERGSDALRSGAVAEARNALEQARELAPNHPGIPALARDLAGG